MSPICRAPYFITQTRYEHRFEESLTCCSANSAYMHVFIAVLTAFTVHAYRAPECCVICCLRHSKTTPGREVSVKSEFKCVCATTSNKLKTRNKALLSTSTKPNNVNS